jgi:hypothetical protein
MRTTSKKIARKQKHQGNIKHFSDKTAKARAEIIVPGVEVRQQKGFRTSGREGRSAERRETKELINSNKNESKSSNDRKENIL